VTTKNETAVSIKSEVSLANLDEILQAEVQRRSRTSTPGRRALKSAARPRRSSCLTGRPRKI